MSCCSCHLLLPSISADDGQVSNFETFFLIFCQLLSPFCHVIHDLCGSPKEFETQNESLRFRIAWSLAWRTSIHHIDSSHLAETLQGIGLSSACRTVRRKDCERAAEKKDGGNRPRMTKMTPTYGTTSWSLFSQECHNSGPKHLEVVVGVGVGVGVGVVVVVVVVAVAVAVGVGVGVGGR